eukprot:4888983-Pyramimonas_sp.AAC.1
MDLLAAGSDHKYTAIHPALVTDGQSSETAGGIAFPVPFDRAELRSFRAIVPGRMGELRVQDGTRQHETTIFNIHSYDLSGSDRPRFKAARQAAVQRTAIHPDNHDYYMI